MTGEKRQRRRLKGAAPARLHVARRELESHETMRRRTGKGKVCTVVCRHGDVCGSMVGELR